MAYGGVQWLSGGVLDSRPRGCGFQPHQHRCVVSLSTTHPSLVLIRPGKTHLFITERLLMGRKESKQTKWHMGFFGTENTIQSQKVPSK